VSVAGELSVASSPAANGRTDDSNRSDHHFLLRNKANILAAIEPRSITDTPPRIYV
jgi:hypothetical protein